jgi:hypothetical protein
MRVTAEAAATTLLVIEPVSAVRLREFLGHFGLLVIGVKAS